MVRQDENGAVCGIHDEACITSKGERAPRAVHYAHGVRTRADEELAVGYIPDEHRFAVIENVAQAVLQLGDLQSATGHVSSTLRDDAGTAARDDGVGGLVRRC